MEALFKLARELAAPKTWSAGVELARNGDFHEDRTSAEGERIFKVIRGPKDRVVRVSLTPADELWQCDCGAEEDPCAHVIATIIAVRQGLKSGDQGRDLVRAGSSVPAFVAHEFVRNGSRLSFQRAIVWDDQREVALASLAAAITACTGSGAGKSKDGREWPKTVAVSKDELQLDHVLGDRKHGILEPRVMRLLLPALARIPGITFDGEPIRINPEPLLPTAEVVDEQGGYRLRRAKDASLLALFENGAALTITTSNGQELRGVEDSALSSEEWNLLKGEGTLFPKNRRVELAGTIVPALAAKMHVEIRSASLPRARKVPPRIVIETIADDRGERLTVVPHLFYGTPPIAEIRGGRVESYSAREVPIRDPIEESRLQRDLISRLGLRLDEAKQLNGESGVHFAKQLKGWETTGQGQQVFTPAATLVPRAVSSGTSIDFVFESESGAGKVTFDSAIRAWRSGSSYVPLSDGGWGAVPTQWLAAHAQVVQRLLAARGPKGDIPAMLVADLSAACDAVGVPVPEYFARLSSALGAVDTIPNYALPEDLTAVLRPYQRVGVNWLSFLREAGLGALLADDMGLGKTLQAMCLVKGRTLVIAPTSVIYSWETQVEKFRPGLSVNVFHGPGRDLKAASGQEVVLTSYAIARIDVEKLMAERFDTVILDEAQIIRNPHSLVAQAVHKIGESQGPRTFRMTLSGTPVENSLQDLWSQFHFINPGLLGARNEFEEQFAKPISSGDQTRVGELRSRVQPFILRRLKRDVAKDLPSKTEVVLECELSSTERTSYEGVLAASRAEVVEKLQSGESIFSALEVLLRLRQACCHLALLPGHEAESSSKVDLLLESLERSLLQGHRSLIFSQWTSLLDLIEPHLTSRGITFSRIDGSTTDRAAIVESFQTAGGPDVMLLSLKAGGLGITLTAADHVYILDPWWNPAVEEHAADRAHRIGQVNPVIVHRLVARDSIEERVLALQDKKRGLLAAAVGESGEISLSRAEVLDLLG